MAAPDTGREPSPTLEAFGAAVRELRGERTLKDIAARADLHWTYISDVERGRKNPGFEAVVRLSRGLGVTPAELVQRFERHYQARA